MKTPEEVDSLFAHIVEKPNRVEANVANLKSGPQELKDAIDEAVKKLIAATTSLVPFNGN